MRSELVKIAHTKGIKSTRGMTIDDLCYALNISSHRQSSSLKKTDKKYSPYKKLLVSTTMASEEQILNDVAGKIIEFLDSNNLEYDSLSYTRNKNKDDYMEVIILGDNVTIVIGVRGNYPYIQGYTMSVDSYNETTGKPVKYWKPYLTGDLVSLFNTQDEVIAHLKKMFRI